MTKKTALFENLTEFLLKKHLDNLLVYLGKRGRTEKTLISYKGFIKRFIKWRRKQPKTFNPLEYFSFDNCTVDGKTSSESTYNTNLSALKTFSKYLYKEGIIENDIFRASEKRKITEKRYKEYLKAPQIQTLLGIGYKYERDRIMLNLMCVLGIRLIEVCRLDHSDIKNYSGHWILSIHGKGRTRLDMFDMNLSDELANDIKSLISTNKTQGENAPIFQSYATNGTGGRITTGLLWSICRKSIKKSGFDVQLVTPHCLRKSAGVLLLVTLLEKGTDKQLAKLHCKEMMRHKDIKTTEIYLKEAEKIERRKSRNAGEDILAQVLKR